MASGPVTPRMIDHLSGRDNNLNLIRVIAASAVLVSHAFPITLGAGAEEPLDEIAGVSLGWLAVAVNPLQTVEAYERERDEYIARMRSAPKIEEESP